MLLWNGISLDNYVPVWILQIEINGIKLELTLVRSINRYSTTYQCPHDESTKWEWSEQIITIINENVVVQEVIAYSKFGIH